MDAKEGGHCVPIRMPDRTSRILLTSVSHGRLQAPSFKRHLVTARLLTEESMRSHRLQELSSHNLKITLDVCSHSLSTWDDSPRTVVNWSAGMELLPSNTTPAQEPCRLV
jgi:hypothetical protein